jgi:chromosome segregation protein
MLKIEKIFLSGFKSFCDPTEVIFDSDGITAIVGPNGCGKSNIADAVNWVIGEQKARLLRGSKMEDVIFQGNHNRPPSGIAEVILTLSVQNQFAIDTTETSDIHNQAIQPEDKTKKKYLPGKRSFLEGEHINIARRLYRSGESEYEMNGKICRLRDIQELFAGTGLGGQHYAIIEQGRIGQVLSAKPLERRVLIEEAAGISIFRMKQRTSELRLEAARQNLSRVKDITLEVERQHNNLKRQSAKARRYQRLRGEMRALLRRLFTIEYIQADRKIHTLEKHLSRTTDEKLAVQATLAEFEQSRSSIVCLINSLEDKADLSRQTVAALTLEIERNKQQQQYLSEQMEGLSSASTGRDREEESLLARHRTIESEITRIERELTNISSEANELTEILETTEKENISEQEKDSAAERNLEELMRGIAESAARSERCFQLKNQFTDAAKRVSEQIKGLELERDRAANQLSSALGQMEWVSSELKLTLAEQEKGLSTMQELDDALSSAIIRKEAAEKLFSNLGDKITEAKYRLSSLRELIERRAWSSEAVQQVIHQSAESGQALGNDSVSTAWFPTRDFVYDQTFHVVGILADYVQVTEGFESAVQNCMSAELESVLVSSLSDAYSAIQYLARKQNGRASFLVTSPSDVNNFPGEDQLEDNSTTQLISLLGLPHNLREAFGKAFPLLARAMVVETDEEAIRQSCQNDSVLFISRSGLSVYGGQLISGGCTSAENSGILNLKREVALLEQNLIALTSSAQAAEKPLLELNESINQFNNQRHELDARLRQSEQIIAVLNEQLQQFTREHERASNHSQIVKRELAQAEADLEMTTVKQKQASISAGKAEEEHTSLKEQITLAQAEVSNYRRDAETRMAKLSTLRSDLATRIERRRSLQNDLRRLNSESNEVTARLAHYRLSASQTEEQISELRSSLSSFRSTLTALEEDHRIQSGSFAHYAIQLTDARSDLGKTEENIRQAHEHLMRLRDEQAAAEVEMARLNSNVEHLKENCLNELGEDLSVVITNAAGDSSPERYQTENKSGIGEADEDEKINTLSYPPSSHHDLEALKAHLAEARSRINELGPVNLVALDEMSSAAERLAFLKSQKADIESAISDTQTAITEIKRRSRERFREAFETINANFSQTFQELFGGGHGEMRLIDENDMLESGIEIIAQPPGKRLQNVLLLSGGEKAMTAIALVLAIFRYKPSPFCLLDEVDAPLDEVNIGRFTEKIREMSRQTQFIIITHSKRTMEAASTLYGITMENPGVSKLLSVRLA